MGWILNRGVPFCPRLSSFVPIYPLSRAELKVTDLRWRRSRICGFLRKSAVFCENLRFPASSNCWNFRRRGVSFENLRSFLRENLPVSAVSCVLQLLEFQEKGCFLRNSSVFCARICVLGSLSVTLVPSPKKALSDFLVPKNGQKRTNRDKTGGHSGRIWETPPCKIHPHLGRCPSTVSRVALGRALI